ncbi:MAG: IS110 family transposase [Alphaproteobacteria bacterium]|nr:IS110 family transposase [Alphaproteobacteria bacterium]
MQEVSTIGLDIAKSVFQVHGVDSEGQVVLRKRLPRGKVLAFFADLPPCLVGIEACPTAHHWSRELTKLGHTIGMMPATYVKAYVKRNKNDANDAEAICEAVQRPNMRFVPIKSKECQAALMLHRSRQLLIKQRTMLSNAIRAYLAEFGIVAPTGRRGLLKLLETIEGLDDLGVPPAAWICLMSFVDQYQHTHREITRLEQCIQAWHRSNELSRRLEEIPGIGPIVATAIVGSIPDAKVFPSGRAMAAWIGLVPQQNSSGGKERLGGITKQGSRHLRWLLVAGAMAVIRYHKQAGFKTRPWLAKLIERKPTKVAAVALANRIARMAWVVMARGERYRDPMQPIV